MPKVRNLIDKLAEPHGLLRGLIHHGTPIHYVDEPPRQPRAGRPSDKPYRHDGRLPETCRNVERWGNFPLHEATQQLFLPREGSIVSH